MASTGVEPSDPSDVSSVGVDLRTARERLGWSLAECAEALRIRRDYLAALEDGRFEALPAAAYATGFLRGYGRALGLDADELVRRFKLEAARGSAQTRLSFPVPVPERGLPTGAMVLLGVLLAVGAYAGWYRLSGEGRLPAEVVPAIPSRLVPLAEQAMPPAGAGRSAATERDIPEPGETPRIVAISPNSAAAAIPLPPVPAGMPPPVTQALLAPASQTASSQTASPLTPPPHTGPTPDAPRLLLRAHGDAWLQVRDRAGQVLLRKVLKAGESWPVPAKTGLLLSTGNAANTELLLDGNQLIALSGGGTSRRDLPLDVDLIKDGKLAPPVILPKPKPPPVETADPAATPASR